MAVCPYRHPGKAAMSFGVLVLVLCCWSLPAHAFVDTNVFNLAYIRSAVVPPSVAPIPAFYMAIDEVNNSTVLMGRHLVGRFADITPGDPYGGFFRALELSSYCNSSNAIDLAIGPTSSRDAVQAAGVFAPASVNIPLISPAAGGVEMSDKSQYPTFSRMIPSHAMQGRAMAALCARMGWRRVNVISTTDSLGVSLFTYFQFAAAELGIQLVTVNQFAVLQNDANTFRNMARSIKASGSWIIVAMIASADYTNFQPFLREQELIGAPYTWVGHFGVAEVMPYGSLSTQVGTDQSSPAFRDLYTRLRRYDPSKTYSVQDYRISNVYDSVWLGAYGIRTYLAIQMACSASRFPTEADGLPDASILPAGALATDICTQYSNAPFKSLLSVLMRNLTLNGTSGLVRMNTNGDRIGYYWVANRYNDTLGTRYVGRIDPNPNNPSEGIPIVSITSPELIVFNDGTFRPPLDHAQPLTGDVLTASLEAPMLVLGFGIAVLGSWTALILIEHAVYAFKTSGSASRSNSRSGPDGSSSTEGAAKCWAAVQWAVAVVLPHVAWCSLSAVALGIGLWASLSIGLTSVSFPSLAAAYSSGSVPPIAFSLSVTFSVLLIGIFAAFFAFSLMLTTLKVTPGPRSRGSSLDGVSRLASATDPDGAGSETSQVSVQNIGAEDAVAQLEKMKAAASTLKTRSCCSRYCWHPRIKIVIITFFAGALLIAAIVAMHLTVLRTLRLPIASSLPGGVATGSAVAGMAVGAPALVGFVHFRGSRWRWIAAFAMAAAVVVPQYLMLTTTVFRFTGLTNGLDGVYDDLGVTADVIRLIAAVLTCVASFLFIGLNVTRLRLSKDVLDRFLMQAQKKIRALEVVISHNQQTIREYSMLIQLIQGARPLVRADHHLLTSLAAHLNVRIVNGTTITPGNTAQPSVGGDGGKGRTGAGDGDEKDRAMTHIGTKSLLQNRTATTTISQAGYGSDLPAAPPATPVLQTSVPLPAVGPPGPPSASSAAHTPSNRWKTRISFVANASSDATSPPIDTALPGSTAVALNPAAGPTGPTVPVLSLIVGTAAPPAAVPSPRPRTLPSTSASEPVVAPTATTATRTLAMANSDDIKSTFAPGRTPSPSPATPARPISAALPGTVELTANVGASDGKIQGRITMTDVINNPVTLEIFKDACAASHNSENVAFMLDVMAFDRAEEPSDRRTVALDIAQTYLNDGAPYPINIAMTQREMIMSQIAAQSFSIGMFKSINHEIGKLLERNDWVRFVETPAFKVCGLILQLTRTIHEQTVAIAARGKAIELLEGEMLRNANQTRRAFVYNTD